MVDGNTFWISSADERVRVWGLDAPEVDMPGGSRATATLRALIAGQQLTCRQRDIDRYGRIVGQCFGKPGTNGFQIGDHASATVSQGVEIAFQSSSFGSGDGSRCTFAAVTSTSFLASARH